MPVSQAAVRPLSSSDVIRQQQQSALHHITHILCNLHEWQAIVPSDTSVSEAPSTVVVGHNAHWFDTSVPASQHSVHTVADEQLLQASGPAQRPCHPYAHIASHVSQTCVAHNRRCASVVEASSALQAAARRIVIQISRLARQARASCLVTRCAVA